MVADRVYVLRSGRILLEESADALRARGRENWWTLFWMCAPEQWRSQVMRSRDFISLWAALFKAPTSSKTFTARCPTSQNGSGSAHGLSRIDSSRRKG